MKYPIGIQNFESLIHDGYVYVDKTALMYKMIDEGRYYFLGRPRRFGKSLLLSTMHAFFEGKRELFQGLAVYDLEKDWVKRPILHLDLNTGKYETPESLYNILDKHLSRWEALYGKGEAEPTPELRFLGIVERACEQTGHRVVILVDEYDKPMLQAIGNEALQNEFRSTLKAFYSVLKTQDKYIKFGFLTGVTKFGKVSVFSDLNNLIDISMDHRFVDICGISEAELHKYFEPSINELAVANGMTYEECCAKLKEQYDGYHFCENSIGIYNPFSLLNTFSRQVFSDYWFETGTPTFLVELLKRNNIRLSDLTSAEQTPDLLNSIDSMNTNPIPIIYQSGYLTIKDYDKRFNYYTLGFPNKEVEVGFNNYLIPYYLPKSDNDSGFNVTKFVEDVESGNPEGFLLRLQSFLEDSDYSVMGKMELYFSNVFYVIFKIMGFYVDVERKTAKGRIDLVLKTPDYIYVMEFKLDGTAAEALQQIEDKGYALPYAHDGRRLWKIGANFSSATKNVDDWIIS